MPPDSPPEDIQDEFPVAYSNPAYFWPGLTAIAAADRGESPFPQARVMGGGSSVMGMWALRGMPDDYNAWRDAGAAGWSWDDVLPFFRKLESDLDRSGPMHGADGPIPIRRHKPESWPLFVGRLVDAARRAGLPLREDINGDFENGVFPVPVTNDKRGRVSSAIGYLTPNVRRRTNLRSSRMRKRNASSSTSVVRAGLSWRTAEGFFAVRSLHQPERLDRQRCCAGLGSVRLPSLRLSA